jgi:hypothetical protein
MAKARPSFGKKPAAGKRTDPEVNPLTEAKGKPAPKSGPKAAPKKAKFNPYKTIVNTPY